MLTRRHGVAPDLQSPSSNRCPDCIITSFDQGSGLTTVAARACMRADRGRESQQGNDKSYPFNFAGLRNLRASVQIVQITYIETG